MSLRRTGFAIALLFATAGLAAEPDVSGFKSYALPAYTLVTHDEDSARLAIKAATQADAALATLLGRAAPARNEPTFVLIVPGTIWARYFSPGGGFRGNFLAGRFANYVVVDDLTPIGSSVAVEYCHLYLQTQFRGIVPIWFDEGVARYVSNVWFRRRAADLDAPYISAYEESDLKIPWATLLELDRNSDLYREREGREAIGRQTWSIVQQGLVTDRKDFGSKLLALVAAQNDLQPAETAVRGSFGMSLEEFDELLAPYWRSGRLWAKKPSAAPSVPDLPAGHVMKRLEALGLVAEIMFESGLNADHLPEVISTIRREAPDSPISIAWQMRLAARAGDAATLQAFAVKLDANANDPALIRGAGLALFDHFQRANQDSSSVAALDLLDRAIMSRPDDIEAIWAYATLASQMKRDLPVALRRIQGASAILPINPYLSQARSLVFGAMDDLPHMRQAAEETLRFSKTPAMTRWAKSLLESNPAKN